MWRLTAFLGVGLALAQQPTQDLILHIDVNLVQVDAVVTDSKGRQVTDLKAEDFELLEDGKPQKVTNLSYIRLGTAPAQQISKKGAAPNPDEPPPPAMARREVKRTIVLVADDLGLSFESTAYVRRALKKFVDERMQPGDLVSILRTSAGLGALQGFTNNKSQLYAAIDAVRWYMNGRAGIGAFQPYVPNPSLSPSIRPAVNAPSHSGEVPTLGEVEDQLAQEDYALGTLGALRQTIDQLRDMPGRKGVILFSDGVPIFLRGDAIDRVRDMLRHVADAANRSSVVVNTVDARGLVYVGPTAADNFETAGDFAQFDDVMKNRRENFIDAQQGLIYLAAETGGRFIHDNNDLNWAVDRVMEDLNSYYLIGYKPDISTWDRGAAGARFHKIQVRVLRPGLHVRSRSGFYGVADEEIAKNAKTRSASLLAALESPFAATDIPVKLTCIFLSDGRHSHIIAMLHIDSRAMTFTEKPDGSHQSVLDLVVTGHDQNGNVLERVNVTETFALTPAEWEDARQNGFLYSANVPIERAGAARFRAAVRDAATGRMGSANEFVRVPDLRRGRITVGGIALGRTDARTGNDTPGVRMFTTGKPIPYRFSVYNMKPGPHGASGRIATRIRVLHDGKETFASDEHPLDVTFQKTSKGIAIEGSFRLARNAAPGEYFLEVIARDANATPKRAMTSLWTNFEISAN